MKKIISMLTVLGLITSIFVLPHTQASELSGSVYNYNVQSVSALFLANSSLAPEVDKGVIKLTTNGGSGENQFLVGEQMKANKFTLNVTNWAKVSFDVKLNSDNLNDIMAFKGRFCGIRTMDKTGVRKNIVVNPDPTWSYDSNNDQYKLNINGVSLINGVDFNIQEWTHFEYWLDMSTDVTNPDLYFRVNEGDLYGPYSIYYPDCTLGSFEITASGAAGVELDLKNIIYSYGDDKDFITAEDRVLSGNNFEFTITSGLGFIGNTSTSSYDNGAIMIRSDGQSTNDVYFDVWDRITTTTIPDNTVWAKLSYDVKFDGDDITAFDFIGYADAMAIDKSRYNNNLIKGYTGSDDNGAYINFLMGETKSKKIYIGDNDFLNKWTHIDYYADFSNAQEKGQADIYLRINDAEVYGPYNELDIGTAFTEVNAGIGGTPSTYGLLRLERDVISKNPDIVFVEFSINDLTLSQSVSAKAYEGILAKLASLEKKPYVVCVGVISNDGKGSRGDLHREIAEQYGLQFIDIAPYM